MTRSWDERSVYFIAPRDLALIKIGSSKLPDRRLIELASMSPVPLELLVRVPGGLAAERALHQAFLGDWSHSEWFVASDALLAVIDHAALFGSLPEFPPAKLGFRLPSQGTPGNFSPAGVFKHSEFTKRRLSEAQKRSWVRRRARTGAAEAVQ